LVSKHNDKRFKPERKEDMERECSEWNASKYKIFPPGYYNLLGYERLFPQDKITMPK
jgi:hypothetical protein